MAAWPRPVYAPKGSPSRLRGAVPSRQRFSLLAPLLAWTGTSIPRRCLASCVSPSLQSPLRRNRTVHLLPFAYASRPRLRCRLTLGGLTFPRNPWASGEQGFHLLSRYSCRDSPFRLVQPSFRSAFSLSRNAPLPRWRSPSSPRSFGGGLSPVELSAQPRLTSELLRTL